VHASPIRDAVVDDALRVQIGDKERLQRELTTIIEQAGPARQKEAQDRVKAEVDVLDTPEQAERQQLRELETLLTTLRTQRTIWQELQSMRVR
jgi:hypothetical protein